MAKPQYGAAHKARRKAWATELTRLGSIPCRCGCGQLIRDGDPWDLGHTTPVARGGNGADSAPEIPGHNRGKGNAIAASRRTVGPSRDWWA